MRARTLVVLFFVVTLSGAPLLARASVIWSSVPTHPDEVRVYTPDLANRWFGGTATQPSIQLGTWNQSDFTTTASTSAHIWARWNGIYVNVLDVILKASSGGDPFYGSGSTTAHVIGPVGSYAILQVRATSTLQEYTPTVNRGITIHQGDELWAFLYPSYSAYGANHWLGSNGTLPYIEICEGSCINSPPSITLLGDATTTVESGSVFADPGATAHDDTDGDLTSAIHVNGSVDAAVMGTTTLTYSVTNSHGLTATTTRVVVVACLHGCYSNVLFLPGIEASRLYYRDVIAFGVGIEHQVWEPDYHSDIPYLAMNADGTSKYQLYTKDIVDTLQAHNSLESTIANMFGNNLDTYSGLEHFMDDLVASSTFGLKEWRAYPYDWRYDVRDIVDNGTPTEMPDGSMKQVYLKDVLEDMASSSPNGKVTIVAHSNGGLLAKALALSLGDDASKYIDRIIMVGTPQWGTPAAVGALLHADNFSDTPNFIVNSLEMRTVMSSMSGSYGLLPTSAYFAHIADPSVTFNAGGLLSGTYATSLGAALASFSPFVKFLEDFFGLDAKTGSVTNLHVPLALPSTMVDKATAMHSALDAWTPPAGITVTAIAGWGQDTVKTLAYTTGSKVVCTAGPAFTAYSACADTPELRDTRLTTQEGDSTVVSMSVVGDIGQKLYFDSFLFKKNGNDKITHQNLTSGIPIQKVITDLLTNKDPTTEQYIVTEKPTGGANPIKLRISSHSPVNIVITDADGKQSGVLPIPGTDFSGVKRDIPDSSVQMFDDEEYISVPESSTYQVVASGYADGPTTLVVETIDGDGAASAASTFKNIPTTASSTATFSLDSANVLSSLAIDINSDGTTDATVASQAGDLTVYEPPIIVPIVSSRATGGHGHSSYTPSIQTVPLIAAITPLIASTTPATTTRITTAPMPRLLTTTSSVPKRSLVLTSPASVTSTMPNVSQTASAYNALSQSSIKTVASAVYNWLQNSWSNFLHVLMRIL